MFSSALGIKTIGKGIISSSLLEMWLQLHVLAQNTENRGHIVVLKRDSFVIPCKTSYIAIYSI